MDHSKNCIIHFLVCIFSQIHYLSVGKEKETLPLIKIEDNDHRDNKTKQEQSDFSPLRIACEYGQDTIVQSLLNKGTHINKLQRN